MILIAWTKDCISQENEQGDYLGHLCSNQMGHDVGLAREMAKREETQMMFLRY